MMSKEEYVLNRVKNIIDLYLKKDQMLNPITLNNLMEQWSFDYEMEKEYRPEILNSTNGGINTPTIAI